MRAKRPLPMRHAPTVAETQALVRTIRNEGAYPANLIGRMLYGCGLRVAEPLNLRIKDVNLERPSSGRRSSYYINPRDRGRTLKL